MRCSKCGAENPERAKFCVECAAPFARRCSSCGSENPPNAKFCLECSKPLIGAGSESRSAAQSANSPVHVSEGSADASLEGERKTVTALFADIKGSMDLMEDIDPEEARAIVDPTLKLMIDAVRHYDGYVVQSTGDGVFAIFGAPVAHEDHPQRALYAALRMQDELRRYSDKLLADGRSPLEIRVGANTGEVVVRSISTGGRNVEYTPIGHTANLASRMQAVAPTGSIAITEHTRRLVEGYFALKPRGPTKIKGVSEPVNVYEVTGLGPLRTRLQRSAARGYTRFVGRQREMDAMKHAAEQAKAGHGQIVAAVAEPGVGKSRLVHEFKARNQSGWMVLEALSFSHDKATAFLPLIDLLWSYFKITPEDDARTRREKVAGKVTMLDRSLEEESLPHLFALLGIVDGEDPLALMDTQIRRRRIHDAVKRILLRESVSQPLMLIFEDLHWIDEETQAFLNLLAEGIANAPILLLVNYRPEYSHQWNSKTYYTQLRLDPLGRESAEEMLSALLGDGAELKPLRRIIIEKTEGNPLFIEEIFQALVEDGSLQRNGNVKLVRPVEQLRLPPTVQGILAARIDRLPAEEKALLQTLAVIGSEFPLLLVREVVQLQPDHLDRLLNSLQSGEFIYEQPAAGDVEYTFKHALTRQVADESLLSERRKQLHERTANAIEALFADRLEDHYSDLTHHYLLSNDHVNAIRYLQLQADHAIARSAYVEAENAISIGLGLLDRLPAGERARTELALRASESDVAIVLHGWSSRQREQAILHTCSLAEQLEETGVLGRALVNLSSFYFTRGEPSLADQTSIRCLEIVKRAPDDVTLAYATFMSGCAADSSGRLGEAASRYAEAMADAKKVNWRDLILPISVWSSSAIHRSTVLAPMGRVTEAIRVAQDGLRYARESRHLYILGHALAIKARTHFCLREVTVVREHVEEAIALSEKHGFAEWMAWGRFLRGWASAELGSVADGVAEMAEGYAAFDRLGGVPFQRFMLAVLAHGYARLGRLSEATNQIDLALQHIERSGEFHGKPEMLRLKGEILLMIDKSNRTEAERCFRMAIDVATAQEARWWELRATTSLAHLLRDTGHRDEARAMLAEIYNWFTEGFDTADLKDAKALLDELGGTS